MALTDTAVKQLKFKGGVTALGKPKTADKHTDGLGLYLLVNAVGKYWRYDYSYAGKRKTLALGVYPSTSLANARKARDRARELLAGGSDPMEEKHSVKHSKKNSAENTFKVLALEWHQTKASGWSPVHTKTVLERMEKNLFPWIGNKSLTAIEAPELVATLRRIEGRGAIETAQKTRTILNAVFRYAIATGRATRNPAADVGVAMKSSVAGHHAAITDPKRFGQMLRDIYTYSGSNIARAALKIHTLTFQRPNEIREMKWAEVDLQASMWVIPSSRMKGSLGKKASGVPHIIPLSRQAVEVLADLKPQTGHLELVFPSERGQGRSISENTCRQALRSMGYLDHTPHGFRASARTLIREELQYAAEVIERQLAHGSDEALGSAYDRTQFRSERVKMMQAWADYLDRLRTGAEVISISRIA